MALIKNLCIIPARGGSKRLPRKNILPINGKPLIAYAIQSAITCGLFDKVCVSTEDVEIEKIALEHSAQVPYKRPDNLATGQARVVDVCSDLIGYLEENGEAYEYFCCIYPTAALMLPEDIANAYNILKEGYLSVLAITEFFFPPQQALVINEDKTISFFMPEIGEKKTQELPDFFVDNGTVYWIKTDEFKKIHSFYTSKTGYYMMPKSRSIDIDTKEDFDIVCKLI